MTVSINQREQQLPESWNALSLRQLIGCYSIIMADTYALFRQRELLPFIRISLARYLLNLSEDFMEQWEADCLATYGDEDGKLVFLAELDQVARIADFLLEKVDDEEEDEATRRYRLQLGLTRCPWPHLAYDDTRGRRRHLLAPADALGNISIYEMGVAFNHFEQFMHTGDEAHAHRLLATLFRPPKPDNAANRRSNYQGDRRLPLLKHETTVERRLPQIEKLPDIVKQILVFWFASCRRAIIDQYQNVFRPGDSAGEEQPAGNDYGYAGLLLSLADGIVHLDAVAAQPYQNALTYLSYLEDQRKLAELRRMEARPINR